MGKGVGPVNQAAFLREEASRYRVLCDLQEALDLLADEPRISELISDSGSNIAMAIPDAATPDDVASVDGGLVKTGGRVRPSGCVKFGASDDITRIILTAMRGNPRSRAAMNLSLKALPACRALGLVIMESIESIESIELIGPDEMVMPAIGPSGRLPEVSLIRGPGEEFGLCLLGASATLLAERALSLARFSEDRKI